jgi:murein DD-endopeptidase MepM/ murein hydrolase activator NlpD
MAQLDPRKQPIRLTPLIFITVTLVALGSLFWRIFDPLPGRLPVMDPASVIALETRAFAAAATRPGFGQPEDLPIIVRKGETLEQAVTRSGVSGSEARAAVVLLAQAYNVSTITEGASFDTAIARPLSGANGQKAQLLGITLRTGPAKQLTVTTSRDGAMRLRALEESVRDERRVAIGRIDGSLYTSAAALGASPSLTNQVMKLFAHKIDFERDIQTGDTFKLIFDRKVSESGRTVESGNLLYAEIAAKGRINRFYSFRPAGSKDIEYYDEKGKNIKGFLLTSPLYGVRSNSGFGMRLHPILGFMKMHTGIDFAASTGTAIQAAGNGVVVDAKWWGGYGRWVRIQHDGGWDTGYAHMSSIAVRPGQRVVQGQVIGYVGTTGRSTGPHLHFEVWRNHIPVDPRSAKVPQGSVLSGSDLVAFLTRRREIDTMVAVADVQRNETQASATTVAMRQSPYRYASQTPTTNTLSDAPTMVRERELYAQGPNVTTTRGTR